MRKVGDKVRIKSIDWYEMAKRGDGFALDGTLYFVPQMAEHCGKEATIRTKHTNPRGIIRYYLLDCDDCAWMWSDGFFEEQ